MAEVETGDDLVKRDQHLREGEWSGGGHASASVLAVRRVDRRQCPVTSRAVADRHPAPGQIGLKFTCPSSTLVTSAQNWRPLMDTWITSSGWMLWRRISASPGRSVGVSYGGRASREPPRCLPPAGVTRCGGGSLQVAVSAPHPPDSKLTSQTVSTPAGRPAARQRSSTSPAGGPRWVRGRVWSVAEAKTPSEGVELMAELTSWRGAPDPRSLLRLKPPASSELSR